MRDKTRKLQDVANLKRIAEAWKICNEKFDGVYRDNMFSVLAGKTLSGVSNFEELYGAWESPNDYALRKDRCILNDPYAYISSGDKWASKVLKETIRRYEEGRGFICNCPYEEGKINELIDEEDGFLLSYAFIEDSQIASMPPATTPLGFTRGLMVNGKWSEKYGLYGSSGGYVVYCDGHVTWFDGSKAAKFLKYDGSGWTSDIRQAIPNRAWISCGQKLKFNYKEIASDPGTELII